MTAYYNEHDPFAAEWLRQLIKHGHIAEWESCADMVTPSSRKSHKRS